MPADTTLDLLERAHAKLTELRDAATSAPWEAMEYDDYPGDEGVCILGGGEAYTTRSHAIVHTLFDEEQSTADAALIVALHRTIDAQFAVLSEAIDDHCKGTRFQPGDPALTLARAILDEPEDES